MSKWNYYKIETPTINSLIKQTENKDQRAIFKLKDGSIKHGEILIGRYGTFIKIENQTTKYGNIKHQIDFIILIDKLINHEYSQEFWTQDSRFKFKEFYESKTDLKILSEIMYIYSWQVKNNMI